MLHTSLFRRVIAGLAVTAGILAPQFSWPATRPATVTALSGATRRAPFFKPLTAATNAKPSGTTSKGSTTGGWQSTRNRALNAATQRLMEKARAMSLPATLKSKAASTSTTGVNFPGFQQAASALANNPADANVAWVSLSADVNKDGKADLITLQNDGSVNVLLNPGNGSLNGFAVTSSNTTASADGVAFVYASAVDLNADGYPDLEVMDVGNNRMYIYMNKKDGTFMDPVATDFTFASGATFASNGGTVLFVDVNGDKIPDMVATVALATFNPAEQTTFSIVTALGKGDGTFAAPLAEQDAIVGGYLSQSWGQVVAADMTNDGKQDLVYLVGGQDTNFNNVALAMIVPGTGQGTFGPFPSAVPATGAIVAGGALAGFGSLYAGDVNGDGNADILFSLGDGNLYTSLGTGTSTPGAVQTVATDLSTPLILGPSIVNFADVTGDGIIDAISYGLGYIAVYSGAGNGTFNATPLAQFLTGEGGEQQPAPADFNGDGHIDLASTNYSDVRIALFSGNDLAHTGTTAIAVPGESAQTYQVLATGDFNGDGIVDVLAADLNGVPVYNEFGFSQPAHGAITSAPSPALAPNLDTLNVNATFPNLKVGVNDGKGNFTYTTAIPSATLFSNAANWVVQTAADLNGDGKADIILGAQQGLTVSLSQSDGTFAAPVLLNLGLPTKCTIENADVGDINGDGFPDIVAAYAGDASCDYTYNDVPTQSGFFVALNDGKGNFTSTFIEYGYGVFLPKLADMNGDGKLDLVLSDSGSAGLGYYLYILPGNGDGTFDQALAKEPLEATLVTSIIPGDFDGDGKMDLALGVETQVDGNGTPVYDTTGLEVMKGNGDLTFGAPTQYASGTYPVDGKAADFNGDGRIDLALNMLTFDYYTNVQTTSFVYLENLGGGSFAPAVQAVSPANAPGNIFTADFNGDGAVDVLESGWVLDESGVSGMFLNSGAVSLSLAASASSISQGGSATLTATLAPSISTATPTGTITFLSNGAVLAIEPVSGTTTVYTLSAPPVGTYTITAVYSGDSNFNTATSSGVAVAVTQLTPTFTLTAPAPTSLSLVQGQTGIVTATLTANAIFSGAVSFTCTGAPSEASCTVSPTSIALSGSQSSAVTVVVATTNPNNTTEAANHTPAKLLQKWLEASGGVSLAGMAFFLLGPTRLKRYRRACMMVLLLTIGLLGAAGISGCGSGNKYAGTPVGSSTLTITATSGTITQSTTVTLNVAK
jgi:hypothetical protein